MKMKAVLKSGRQAEAKNGKVFTNNALNKKSHNLK